VGFSVLWWAHTRIHTLQVHLGLLCPHSQHSGLPLAWKESWGKCLPVTS
jgi:hypothetical protein